LFKIVGKSSHSGWVRYHLDDYVTYNNGRYKSIDFDDRVVGPAGLIGLANFLFDGRMEPFVPDEGCYVKIDLERTCNYDGGHDFNPYSAPVRIVGREKIDSEGNVSILASTGELCEEIITFRERCIARTEYSS